MSQGPYIMASECLDGKLIDTIDFKSKFAPRKREYDSNVLVNLRKLVFGDAEVQPVVRLERYLDIVQLKSPIINPKQSIAVAIVYFCGGVHRGESKYSGGSAVAKALLEAGKDKSIDTIVFRIRKTQH